MRESMIIIIQSKPSRNFTIFQLQQLPPKQNHLTSTSLSPSLFLFLTQAHAHAHKHSFTRTSSQREIPADPIVPRQIQLISPPYRNAISGRPRSPPPPPHPLFPYLLHFISHSFLWVSAFWVCESLGFISVNVVLFFFFGWGLDLFALFWISMILESNLLSFSRFAFCFLLKVQLFVHFKILLFVTVYF